MKKLLKEWLVPEGDTLPAAAELLHVSDDMDDLIRIAIDRAKEVDLLLEPEWVGKSEGESGSMWIPVRDEFRHIIQ